MPNRPISVPDVIRDKPELLPSVPPEEGHVMDHTQQRRAGELDGNRAN